MLEESIRFHPPLPVSLYSFLRFREQRRVTRKKASTAASGGWKRIEIGFLFAESYLITRGGRFSVVAVVELLQVRLVASSPRDERLWGNR